MGGRVRMGRMNETKRKGLKMGGRVRVGRMKEARR